MPKQKERGPNGGRMFLGQELCPVCDCCSLAGESCEQCGGDGVYGHDCGEDTCCCLDPEDNVICDACYGKGFWLICRGKDCKGQCGKGKS